MIVDAVSISVLPVNFYVTTRHSIQEDRHLRIHRRENLKSHTVFTLFKRLNNQVLFPYKTHKITATVCDILIIKLLDER
jgi:hypothetical protein